MKRCACLLAISLAVPAHANGAMGLGLEIFDFWHWTVYVLTTVALEAWLIGRWLGMTWPTSIAVAAVANLFTAMMCTQMAAPALHGSGQNPNPLGFTLQALLILGVISALLEAIVWGFAARKATASASPIVFRCLWVHMVGVVLALAILLVPDRPYIGLESQAGFARRFNLQRVSRNVETLVRKRGGVPQVKTFEELIRLTHGRSEDWLAAYVPNFHRFDVGEARRVPYDLNPRAAGARLIGGKEPRRVWLVRLPDMSHGLTVDLASGEIQVSYDSKELGD